MTGVRRAAIISAAAACSLVAVLLLLGVASNNVRAGHSSSMGPISIDMDPAGNTATGLGTREPCAEVNPGDTITFDVTAEGIPPFVDGGTPDLTGDHGGMLAFSYTLGYNEAPLTLQSHDFDFLIGTNPGSLEHSVSQFLPDTDGNNEWVASVGDSANYVNSPPESGSGVLSRLTMSVTGGAAPGHYALQISFGGVIDPQNNASLPSAHNSAILAVGVDCSDAPVTPPPGQGGGEPTTPPQPPNPVPSPGPGIGPMQRMSIDMDPSGNTGSSLSALNSCGEATPGGIFTFDVTARGIPPHNINGTPGNRSDDYGGMAAFAVTLLYPETYLTVLSQDVNFMIAATPGSLPRDVSQAVPDTDGDDRWASAGADSTTPTNTNGESGDGVLTRMNLHVESSTPPGQYQLVLGDSGHIDAHNYSFGPNGKDNALIAVGVPCDIDFDGVPDEDDVCVNYAGPPDNGGCSPAEAPAVGGVVGLIDEARPAESSAAERDSSVTYAVAGLLASLVGGACAWAATRRQRQD